MLARKGGRPRNVDAPRDEQGRIRSSHYQQRPEKLGQWNRLRDNLGWMASDPRIATQRGKLFYTHQLTELEFEAANLWADMLAKFDYLILGRRRSPAPPALERSSPGMSGEMDGDYIERFREAFKKAHDALLTAGKVAEAAVTKLCREEGSGAMLVDAKRGLGALAVHFGLTGRKR